jgi:hypothetical protein
LWYFAVKFVYFVNTNVSRLTSMIQGNFPSTYLTVLSFREHLYRQQA